jgi:glycosyltransferase involved in cell wall biosynthesis
MLDVLLPLNRVSDFLEDSLSSIGIAQRYLLDKLKFESELILIVNGIEHQQINKIECIAERSNLIKYRIIQSENYGISAALNKGIGLSSSPFLARTDDDDLVMKDRFVRQIETFTSNSNIFLIGSYGILIDANGREIGRLKHPKSNSEIQEFLLFQNCFIHSSVMFRRAVLQDVGLYRPELDGVEDYDLWCRISNRGGVMNLPEYLVKHRLHDQQTTNTLNQKSNLQLRKIFLNNIEKNIYFGELTHLEKSRFSQSLLALNLSRRHFSLKSQKKFLSVPYLLKSWILSPVLSPRIFLRILKFKCFSR